MESNRLKTLQILEAIAEDKPTSQRELSHSLQVSLGMVNSFIKRLVSKGYCKVTTIPNNRVKYMLTPAGAMEKTRLTYEYISITYNNFKAARNRLRELYDELQRQGKTRLVFYGTGDVAEIAYLSMAGTDMKLVSVIDPEKKGNPFANHVIGTLEAIDPSQFDVLLITATNDHESIVDSTQHAGIPEEKTKFIF